MQNGSGIMNVLLLQPYLEKYVVERKKVGVLYDYARDRVNKGTHTIHTDGKFDSQLLILVVSPKRVEPMLTEEAAQRLFATSLQGRWKMCLALFMVASANSSGEMLLRLAILSAVNRRKEGSFLLPLMF